MFGLVQAPFNPHAGSQMGVVQVSPVKPVLHVQVLGSVHLPLLQLARQTGVLQAGLIQPLLHAQLYLYIYIYMCA